MSQDNGGPAFPVSSYVNEDGQTRASAIQGMSLRDYFAAKAMQGLAESFEYESETKSPEMTIYYLAMWSYEIADAMLIAREK